MVKPFGVGSSNSISQGMAIFGPGVNGGNDLVVLCVARQLMKILVLHVGSLRWLDRDVDSRKFHPKSIVHSKIARGIAVRVSYL